MEEQRRGNAGQVNRADGDAVNQQHMLVEQDGGKARIRQAADAKEEGKVADEENRPVLRLLPKNQNGLHQGNQQSHHAADAGQKELGQILFQLPHINMIERANLEIGLTVADAVIHGGDHHPDLLAPVLGVQVHRDPHAADGFADPVGFLGPDAVHQAVVNIHIGIMMNQIKDEGFVRQPCFRQRPAVCVAHADGRFGVAQLLPGILLHGIAAAHGTGRPHGNILMHVHIEI